MAEQRYWLHYGQGEMPLPDINKLFAYGAPACTPPLDEVWQAWRAVTAAADPWLDSLTTEDMALAMPKAFRPGVTRGSLLLRVNYHYWYHIGENMAIRQMLGHTGLPDFVGNLDDKAPYRPE